MSDSISFQRAIQDAKEQAEESMQRERLEFGNQIAEKDGRIAKFEMEQAAHLKERERFEVSICGVKK